MKDPFQKTPAKEQALQKLKHYCAYQERCHLEVKEKLYGFGLHKAEVDTIISQLIEENYLNEERFAIQYAGGKFRMNDWGKVKIRHALKFRQVSEYCIKKALQAIDAEGYGSRLQSLAKKKWDLLKKEKNALVRSRKVHDYLLQKGYESDMIRNVLKNLDDR